MRQALADLETAETAGKHSSLCVRGMAENNLYLLIKALSPCMSVLTVCSCSAFSQQLLLYQEHAHLSVYTEYIRRSHCDCWKYPNCIRDLIFLYDDIGYLTIVHAACCAANPDQWLCSGQLLQLGVRQVLKSILRSASTKIPS